MNFYRHPSALHHGVAACDVPGFFSRCSISGASSLYGAAGMVVKLVFDCNTLRTLCIKRFK